MEPGLKIAGREGEMDRGVSIATSGGLFLLSAEMAEGGNKVCGEKEKC